MLVENLDLRRVAETLGQKVRDTLLSDAVLNHLYGLDLVVELVSLGPGGHASVLQSVATANNSLKIGNVLSFLSSGLLLAVKLRESVGDEDTSMRTHAVVVQVEVLKRDVGGEESHERRLNVQAESIVVKVDSVEFGEVENRGQERGDGVGNLAQESTGEDVGEVGDLK